MTIILYSFSNWHREIQEHIFITPKLVLITLQQLSRL